VNIKKKHPSVRGEETRLRRERERVSFIRKVQIDSWPESILPKKKQMAHTPQDSRLVSRGTKKGKRERSAPPENGKKGRVTFNPGEEGKKKVLNKKKEVQFRKFWGERKRKRTRLSRRGGRTLFLYQKKGGMRAFSSKEKMCSTRAEKESVGRKEARRKRGPDCLETRLRLSVGEKEGEGRGFQVEKEKGEGTNRERRGSGTERKRRCPRKLLSSPDPEALLRIGGPKRGTPVFPP